MELTVMVEPTFLNGVAANEASVVANNFIQALGLVGEKITRIKVWLLPIDYHSTVGGDDICLLYSVGFDLPFGEANRTFQFTQSGRWRSYSANETRNERFNEPEGEPEDLTIQWCRQLVIMVNRTKAWLQSIAHQDSSGQIVRWAEQIPLQKP